MDTDRGCQVHFKVIRILGLGINGQLTGRIEIGNDTARTHAAMCHIRYFELVFEHDIRIRLGVSHIAM